MKIAHWFHDGLRIVAMGGPIAVALAGLGGILLALAPKFGDDHREGALTGVGVLLVVLAFVEWALSRKFAQHEIVERAQRDELVEKLMEASKKNLDATLSQVESVGVEYDQIHEKVKELASVGSERGKRIVSLEERVTSVEGRVSHLEVRTGVPRR